MKEIRLGKLVITIKIESENPVISRRIGKRIVRRGIKFQRTNFMAEYGKIVMNRISIIKMIRSSFPKSQLLDAKNFVDSEILKMSRRKRFGVVVEEVNGNVGRYFYLKGK